MKFNLSSNTNNAPPCVGGSLYGLKVSASYCGNNFHKLVLRCKIYDLYKKQIIFCFLFFIVSGFLRADVVEIKEKSFYLNKFNSSSENIIFFVGEYEGNNYLIPIIMGGDVVLFLKERIPVDCEISGHVLINENSNFILKTVRLMSDDGLEGKYEIKIYRLIKNINKIPGVPSVYFELEGQKISTKKYCYVYEVLNGGY